MSDFNGCWRNVKYILKVTVRLIIRFTFLLIIIIFLNTCKGDFLNVEPAGNLNQYTLANEQGIEAMLIGAYSMLDGVSEQFGWGAAASNWLYGSIRGLEANKGTDAGDSNIDLNAIQNFSENATYLSQGSYLNTKWEEVFEAIARCNNTIRIIDQSVRDKKIGSEAAEIFLEQARALRGWYHFEAWRLWAKIPFIDENTGLFDASNKQDIRQKILDDLAEGTRLPENMGAIGKFNKTVSEVLLAKAYMQMNHDYQKALELLLIAKDGTKPDGSPIGLAPTYSEIFDIENRNGIEAVYTVQTSVNDGSGGINGGYGEALNFPYSAKGPAGCCGFFQPTQEFVNSFRTDESGLPMLDFSYNLPENAELRDQGIKGGTIWDPEKTYSLHSSWPAWSDACTYYDPSKPYTDLAFITLIDNNKGNNPLTSPDAWKLIWTEDNSKTVDPRLDWSVGRRGIPYWDWGVHTGSDWIRDQAYAGPYSPKKMVYKKSQEGIYTEVGNWTSGFTANGYRMIRYADLLLLLSECQIETGDLDGALENINKVRERASNPAGFVKEADGITDAANYFISLYPSFPDKEIARKALYMERKLELGQEGHRWFDLNRWGITVTELNRALDYEKTTPWGIYLYWNAVVGKEDVTFPIPQYQIDLSNGKLVQNR